MNVDFEDLRKRYASMSDEELVSIKREDLVDAERECYDQEVVRRSSSKPPPNSDSMDAGSEPSVGKAGVGRELSFFTAILWSSVLFVGVAFFWFEDVAKWLGILCHLAGAVLTLKIVSDQKRSAGLWAVLSLMLGPIAALLVLAQRSLIALLPLVVCPVVVFALLAVTGQGSFRVVKTSEVSGGYNPRAGIGENLCGKVVNVEGDVIATGLRLVDSFSEVYLEHPGFAVSDGSQEASAKEYKKTAVLSPQDRVDFASAKIVGHYPLPRVGDRLRVSVVVRCDPLEFSYFRYTLLEVSRRPAH